MANDLNDCKFVGRLGADVDTKFTPSGDAVANFRIAVGWKTKTAEGTEWVPIVAFGKLAEICGQYLKKGSQVLVSGRFRTRKWQAQDGSDRYSTEIVADQMQMLGSKQSNDAPSQPRKSTQQRPSQAAPAPVSGAPNYDDFDDMIPF